MPSPLLPIAIACFGSIGAFKGFPGLTASPVDLTLVLAAVVAALAAFARPDGPQRAGRRRVLTLWALFLPGVVIATAIGLPLSKSLYLITITLTAALAGATLRREQLRIWIAAQVLLAAAMALLIALFPESSAERDFGRSVFVGGTSISAARVVGIGIVVAVVLLSRHTGARYKAILLPMAGVLTVSLFSIGSRGPFVAVLVACAAGLLLGRSTASRKLAAIGVAAAVSGVAMAMIGAENSRALSRVLSVFSSPSDPARAWLATTAGDIIVNTPLGVGWGGFSDVVAQQSSIESSRSYPHNLVLEVMAENGWIPGLAALMWIALLVASAGRARVDGALGLVFPLLTYWLVNAMFSSDINGNRELWITLGVAATLLVAPRTKNRHPVSARARGMTTGPVATRT